MIHDIQREIEDIGATIAIGSPNLPPGPAIRNHRVPEKIEGLPQTNQHMKLSCP